ncbi:hypothetical protein [Micavibrio aeruginosavorus]|uniref:Uncharacterized protein n=1 Tax=Micavibrio aeruginosavorus (strain ARL-13) TaxID=856793 RepID=G2KMY7_MICAA|nr:hypothetical protein [Micavibrio aeruginosavorus]AEP08919.1 hypothetical protein MICA_582 [Micavibrio aeruginosavorus ARL-13]
MVELFTALQSELNSSVFVLIVILVMAFVLTFKVGGWKQTFIEHQGRIDKVEKISDLIVEIKTKVDLIYQNNPNALYRAQSPISLTDLGRELATKVNADSIIEKYSSKLVKHVDDKGPKNAYDIQKCAFTVARNELKDLLSDVELTAVKQEAFNRGLPVEEIYTLFGILLRNKILKDKGIPIADVDKHEKASKE